MCHFLSESAEPDVDRADRPGDPAFESTIHALIDAYFDLLEGLPDDPAE